MIHSVDYKGPFIHPAWLVEFLSDFFTISAFSFKQIGGIFPNLFRPFYFFSSLVFVLPHPLLADSPKTRTLISYVNRYLYYNF